MYESNEELLVEFSDHILTITLNRPERLNAISAKMLSLFSETLTKANSDREVRAVILTGAGRGFCSGLDLKEQMGSSTNGVTLGRGGYSVFDLQNSTPIVINRMDKPMICALNGAAAGFGMDMALGCDIRIASENAKLGAVFTKRGIVPESGGTWYLPRLVGWARAAEIAFLGDVLDAQRSFELGLVNRVVPHDDLMTEARALATRIANNAPLAVQTTKRMMRLGLEESFEAAVDHVYLQLRSLAGTEDFRESVVAFNERREPSFKGQ